MDRVASSEQQVLKQRAYSLLKERIITWQLRPGQFLSEKGLGVEFGMSRTPIREALALLTQESLVRVEPRRGAFVAELSIHDILEIFELREAIETWVVRKVAGRSADGRLAEFERAFREGHAYEEPDHRHAVALLDQEFHNYLVELAENRRCSALYRNLQDQNQRVRFLSSLRPERLQASRAEHLRICTTLMDGNVEEAARCMLQHIQNARTAALQIA
jgi:DNA-binding GntR family transcriptional regulator